MTSTDAYIIFEADQVLTNDHLNDMFDYLDTQERLTRNKLIGIGVVCGLEIDNLGDSIVISKGCGVTSKGYLIVWREEDEAPLVQYTAYTLPARPAYTPFLNGSTQYDMWLLLNKEDADKTDAPKFPVGPALKDKIVILFLEANEKDLKNCDTQDCNDKGREMRFTVRPILMNKADVDKIIEKQKKLSGDESLSNSYIERLGLKELALKRFDVKATPLQDAYDIYDAYLACFTDDVLKNIADSYSQCYSIFQPILGDYGNTNPFKDLQSKLKELLSNVKSSMPIYIQYYYDFLDDLVKAYCEFKDRSFEVITECCPDEDQFPMHLMLGEATVDTNSEIRSPYRHYFISSPLFNNQTALLKEVKLLFDRMVTLVKSLFIPVFNTRQGVPIRITPSKWSQAPLSARAIPFYYNITYVSKNWNPFLAGKGKSNYNLSYNADKYSPQPPDIIVNPLQYGIEPFDFYRIEGHIGQPFSSVLNVILSIRNTNRLPFDVIALKAGTDASDTTIKYDCHFEDLESQLILLRAELACKMHEPLCIAAKVPSQLRFTTNVENTTFNFLNTLNVVHSLALQDVVGNQNKIITNFVQTVKFTSKGDFLKTYCPVTKGTLGAEYVDSGNKYFPRPTQIELNTSSGAKAALMHLIDITEALMQTITGASTIYNFKYDNFKRIYDGMISFFTDFMQALLNADNQQRTLSPLLYGNLEAVVTGCMDEKIKALTLEYTKRVEKIQKQNLLSEYLSSNPGIDHKAGVPRGGTFILVYHEAPPSTATLTAAANTLTNLATATTATLASAASNTAATSAAAASATGATTATAATAATAANTTKTTTKLAETSLISQNNLTKILKLFDSTDLQLTEAQANTLKNLTLQQFAVAAAKPPFNIPDNAVVADFYLPYLCCSDCPPVTYVLPKVPPEILTLTLEKTDFCNNDEKTYPVTVNPLGGKLTASAGGIDADKFEFKPKGLAAGNNKITYTLPDGRSTSVDVKITASFEVEFESQVLPDDALTVKFSPSNTQNKAVSWNFGDGTGLSTEQSPTHKFTLADDTQTFVVTLTATDGPCIVTRQHEIRLTKPTPQVFFIKPALFCSNDGNRYTFTANPAIADAKDIGNPNNLNIDKDAAGNIGFTPAKQNLQQTTSYHLVYKGVAADLTIQAVFSVEFRVSPLTSSPFARKFTASNIDNRQVEWDFGDGTPVSTEPSPSHTYQFDGQQQTFVVRLTVTDGPCKVTTEQPVVISRPVQNTFSIEPLAFCIRDKGRKVLKIAPEPASVGDIKNINKLRIEQDATSKEIFFIPARQDISQTTEFPLSYQGIDLKVTIFVPDAGFIMDIRQNTSPLAQFPVLLNLRAKEQNADSYIWTLSNNFGQNVEIKEKEIKDFDMAKLRDPNNSITPLNIVLVVSFSKRTGVACEDKKDYIITADVLGNHRNKGEFDNLARS